MVKRDLRGIGKKILVGNQATQLFRRIGLLIARQISSGLPE